MSEPTRSTSLGSRALPEPPLRRRWLSILLGVAIFCSGVIVGGSATLIALRHVALHTIHHPEELPDRLTGWLRYRLKLSDQQAQAMKAILIERQSAIWAVRRECQPRVQAELDRLREQIAAVLDRKQAEKWRERFDRIRRIWWPAPPEQQPGPVSRAEDRSIQRAASNSDERSG